MKTKVVKKMSVREVVAEVYVPMKICVGLQARIHPSYGLSGIEEEVIEVIALDFFQNLTSQQQLDFLSMNDMEDENVDGEAVIISYMGVNKIPMMMNVETFANHITCC